MCQIPLRWINLYFLIEGYYYYNLQNLYNHQSSLTVDWCCWLHPNSSLSCIKSVSQAISTWQAVGIMVRCFSLSNYHKKVSQSNWNTVEWTAAGQLNPCRRRDLLERFCEGRILRSVHLSLPLIKTMNSCGLLGLNRVWSSPQTPIHALLIICCRAERRRYRCCSFPDRHCYANIVCCYIWRWGPLRVVFLCESISIQLLQFVQVCEAVGEHRDATQTFLLVSFLSTSYPDMWSFLFELRMPYWLIPTA